LYKQSEVALLHPKINTMNTVLLRRFYIIGVAEAISFLLLLGVAMPLKYLAGMPMAVSIVGMAHGLLFMAYLYLAYDCWQTLKWPFRRFFLAGVASLLPFGPFWFHRRYAG
jgi:integral membrane protein